MRTNQLRFVDDVLIDVTAGSFETRPAGVDYSKLATLVDAVMTSSDDFDEFKAYLLKRVGKRFARLQAESADSAKQEYEDGVFLRALTQEQAAAFVAKPLRNHTVEELRMLRADQLVISLIALEELQSLIFESLSQPWLDYMSENGEMLRRRRADAPPALDISRILKGLGFTAETESVDVLCGNPRDAENLQKKASSSVLPRTSKRIPAKELNWVSGEATTQNDVLLVEVQKDGQSLRIQIGGLGFVEDGCTATVTWRNSRKVFEAEGKIVNEDKPLVLKSSSIYAASGQYLDIDFVRTGDQPMHFSASFMLQW